MTDTDGEKLDQIIKKLEWMTNAIQSLGIQLQNLAATLQQRKSPEPPPAPPKRQ